MNKYRCTQCTHVYDPADGDAHNDVPPETPFDELLEEWRCPSCGADKLAFQAVDEPAHWAP